MAVVIGGLLPLVGLSVAVAGSEYARIAVFRLQKLVEQQRWLTKQVEEKTQAAEQASEKARLAEARAQELGLQLQGLEGQVAELQVRETALEGRVSELERRKRDLERRNRELEQRVKEAEQKLKEAEQKLKESEEKLKESEKKLKEADEERKELEQENRVLDNRRKLLQTRLGHLNLQVEIAGENVEAAKEEVRSRELELAQKRQELADVEAEYQKYRQRQQVIAGEPALFNPGDELRRWVISGDQTQDQMESELWELLHLASPIAEARGVPVGANGRAISVVAPVPPQAASVQVGEGTIVRYVASELRRAGEKEYVVRLRAFHRLSPGDETQLEVEFRTRQNRLLFKAGEVLVETRIPAEAPRLEIFEGLWRIIANQETSQVRALARARRMLPHPETGQYGAFTLADMFNAVDEVRALEGLVPVRALAAKDTYTVGPLMVEIQVGEREEP